MSDTTPCAWSAEAAADRIAESLANESNLVLSDRDTAILRRHLRAFAEANRPVPSADSVEVVARAICAIRTRTDGCECATAGPYPATSDCGCEKLARAALTAIPPTTLADVPVEEREAVREILAQWQQNVGDNPTTWSEPIATFLTRLEPQT